MAAIVLVTALSTSLFASDGNLAARTGMHSFENATVTDQQFLTEATDGKPVVIAGELRLPSGTGKAGSRFSPWFGRHRGKHSVMGFGSESHRGGRFYYGFLHRERYRPDRIRPVAARSLSHNRRCVSRTRSALEA
jgi:hypothetical protein